MLQLIVELPREQQSYRLMLTIFVLFLLMLIHCFTKLADLIVPIRSLKLKLQLEQPLLFVELLTEQQLFLSHALLVQLFK